MKKIGALSVVAALALAVLAAGCGGSSDKPLSHADFISQADAICKKSEDQIAAAQRKLGSSPSQTQINDFVKSTVIPGIQSQLDGINGLTPPEADRTQVDAVVAAAQDGLDQAAEDPRQINNTAFEKANKLGAEYGFRVCAQG